MVGASAPSQEAMRKFRKVFSYGTSTDIVVGVEPRGAKNTTTLDETAPFLDIASLSGKLLPDDPQYLPYSRKVVHGMFEAYSLILETQSQNIKNLMRKLESREEDAADTSIIFDVFDPVSLSERKNEESFGGESSGSHSNPEDEEEENSEEESGESNSGDEEDEEDEEEDDSEMEEQPKKKKEKKEKKTNWRNRDPSKGKSGYAIIKIQIPDNVHEYYESAVSLVPNSKISKL